MARVGGIDFRTWYHVFGYVNERNAGRVQRASLSEAKREFTLAGPELNISAVVSVYNSSTKRWLDQHSKVGYQLFQQPNTGYLILSIINAGRSAGAVTQAGFIVDAKQSTFEPASVLCTDPSRENLSDCTFPVKLDVGNELDVYLFVGPAVISTLTCNTYTSEGVVGYVGSADGTKQLIRADAALDVTSSCSALTPPSNKRR